MEITEDIQGSISYLIRKEYNTIYKKKITLYSPSKIHRVESKCIEQLMLFSLLNDDR